MAGISDSIGVLTRAALVQRDRLYDMRVELLEYATGLALIAGLSGLGFVLPHFF